MIRATPVIDGVAYHDRVVEVSPDQAYYGSEAYHLPKRLVEVAKHGLVRCQAACQGDRGYGILTCAWTPQPHCFNCHGSTCIDKSRAQGTAAPADGVAASTATA